MMILYSFKAKLPNPTPPHKGEGLYQRSLIFSLPFVGRAGVGVRHKQCW